MFSAIVLGNFGTRSEENGLYNTASQQIFAYKGTEEEYEAFKKELYGN